MARDNCPNCGADLPPKAKACPECGSDEKTGWSDEAHVGGLNLPEDNFDYDEFVENEFGDKKQIKPRGVYWVWWLVAILVLASLIVPLTLSLLHR